MAVFGVEECGRCRRVGAARRARRVRIREGPRASSAVSNAVNFWGVQTGGVDGVGCAWSSSSGSWVEMVRRGRWGGGGWKGSRRKEGRKRD